MSQTSNASEAQRSWEVQMHQQRPPTRLLARSSWVVLVQKNIVKDIAAGNPGLPGTLFTKADRIRVSLPGRDVHNKGRSLFTPDQAARGRGCSTWNLKAEE